MKPHQGDQPNTYQNPKTKKYKHGTENPNWKQWLGKQHRLTQSLIATQKLAEQSL